MEAKKIYTDADIDALMEDWFERDGETFVKKRTTDRLGWEKDLEGFTYSEYLLESPTKEDLIKSAYSLASEMLVAMELPYKVHVKLISKTSATDGRVVYVDTDVFDDDTISTGERLDVFFGLTIHEGCHVLWTDMGKITELLDKIPYPKQLVHDLFNIIEDERIEMLCGEEKPGYANFIEKAKYYYFDKVFMDSTEEREKSPLETIVDLILHIIRYPAYLNEVEVVKFAEYLEQIKEILLPYPQSSVEALEAAQRIYDVIKEYYVDIETEKMSCGGGSGDSSGSESSESTGSTDEASGEKPLEESESKSSGGSRRELTEEEKEEALRRAMGELLDDSHEVSRKLEKITKPVDSVTPHESSSVAAKGHALGEMCEGVLESPSKDVYFSKREPNKEEYMKCAKDIRKYVPAISKILKGNCREYKLIHKSMRSGVLDTAKIAEAYQGVPTVYMREGAVKTDKICVCIVIDESGSMHGSKIAMAKRGAILLNEALSKIPNVELFIYGHSGDMRYANATEINIYREKNYRVPFTLGSAEALKENRDGVAIKEIAKRVRKQTKEPVIMFVLSDGAPCASSYHGDIAINHTREAVLEAEKLGMSIIQICIETTYDPSKMFKKFLVLNDWEHLPLDLGRVIRKAVTKNTKSYEI